MQVINLHYVHDHSPKNNADLVINRNIDKKLLFTEVILLPDF